MKSIGYQYKQNAYRRNQNIWRNRCRCMDKACLRSRMLGLFCPPCSRVACMGTFGSFIFCTHFCEGSIFMRIRFMTCDGQFPSRLLLWKVMFWSRTNLRPCCVIGHPGVGWREHPAQHWALSPSQMQPSNSNTTKNTKKWGWREHPAQLSSGPSLPLLTTATL